MFKAARSTFRLASSSKTLALRFFATPQPAVLDRNMGTHQWYIHLSRDGAGDISVIKKVLTKLRRDCRDQDIKLVLAFGPTLLKELAPADIPADFQPFETVKSKDGSGREAKGTQEELLLWLNANDKGKVWRVQFEARQALKGHMKVARETPTFIYGASLDMTGFIDGTGNPDPSQDVNVAIVPEGPGSGGSFVLAQRWVHDLTAWERLPVTVQEKIFGRTKDRSIRLPDQAEADSHLGHVDLRHGKTGDDSKPKRDEMSRRSTPVGFSFFLVVYRPN